VRGNRQELTQSRGFAVVAALLAMGLFSALGMALAISSSVDRLAAANHEDAVHLLNMADAALELAARDLGTVTDWSEVLDGRVRSPMVDGPPSGVRRLSPDAVIDLTGLTNDITCGKLSGCTDVDRMASTAERPWGANNPWWRPFLHGPLPQAAHPRLPRPVYVIVWLGDDGSEVDGSALVDGGGAAGEGRYIVRARAAAFGEGRASRAIEAELARICAPSASGETCLPGIRVQSWRVVAAVP
jgi:type II secretory pathway pseudopilin PulG